jgi:hypothetical protein
MQTLLRRYLHSKCNKASQYAHKWNYIYGRKKSKASRVPVLTKIRNPQQHFIPCTDFQQNREINVDSKNGISFAPLMHGLRHFEFHEIYKFSTVLLAEFLYSISPKSVNKRGKYRYKFM